MRRDVLRLFVTRRKLDGLGYIVDYGFVDDERLSIGSRTRRASAQEHPAEELGHVPQGSTLEESKLLAVDVLIFLQLRIERFSVTSKREQSFRIVYSKLWNFSEPGEFSHFYLRICTKARYFTKTPRNRQMLLDWRIFLRSLYLQENTGYHESFKFYEFVFSMSLSSSSKVATFLQKRKTSRTLRIS